MDIFVQVGIAFLNISRFPCNQITNRPLPVISGWIRHRYKYCMKVSPSRYYLCTGVVYLYTRIEDGAARRGGFTSTPLTVSL